MKRASEFESTAGNSGTAFTQDRAILLGGQHLEQSFTDVDAAGTFVEIQSCAFVPLHGCAGNSVGVLQLYNKVGDGISKSDLEVLKLMQESLGRMLETMMTLGDALDFMLNARFTMEKIMKSGSVKSIEYEEGAKIFEEILKLVNKIKIE